MSSFATLGSEFRVNTTIVGTQYRTQVAGLAGGGFVVVYVTPNITTGGDNVVGRIYDAAGVPIAAGEFIVAAPSGPITFATSPEVTALGAGFVVTYVGSNLPPSFGPQSVFAETYDSAGVGAGDIEVAVSSNNSGHLPHVAQSTLGGYLAVWEDDGAALPDTDGLGVYARVNGGGALITVNTTTADNQGAPSVAALQDGTGNYVVAWSQSDGVLPSALKGQILAADGSKIGGELTFDNSISLTNGTDVEIAARPGGGWVVAYIDAFVIRTQVYSTAGVLLADFQGNDLGCDNSDVAVLSNGLIAVGGRDFATFSFAPIKVFAPDGTQVGVTINLQAGNGSGIVAIPSIAALANGQFAVTWGDRRGILGDPDHGITGQRFSTSVATLIDGGIGADAFNGVTQTGFFLGYGGFDSVSYATAGAAVTVDLANPALNAGAAAGDEFGDTVELIIGSNFGDGLAGNARANSLDGGNGNDTLRGAAGDDTLVGGAGLDTASYAGALAGVTMNLNVGGSAIGGGADSGSDTLTGIENLTGGDGADTFFGSNSANVLKGGLGADQLRGNGGADRLEGEAGNDALFGGAGNDTLNGGTETDTANYSFATGAVTVDLNVIIAQAIGGGEDSDTLIFVENVIGSDFADTLTGNAGFNSLVGGDGTDTLNGGTGNDTLNGGNDADSLIGGIGNDNLIAGAGNDTLIGGGGADVMSGGADFDRFVFTANADLGLGVTRDRISDFVQGLDLIDLAGVDAIVGGADNAFTFIGAAAFSGVAGQLRFVVSGPRTFLEGDTNGDSTRDFQIELSGVFALVAGDFVL